MLLEDLFQPAPASTDAPREGFYQWMRRGRPAQPVRIWYGAPHDPDTGEELDRSWRWQMLCSGDFVALGEEEKVDKFDPIWTDIWPQCSAHPIPEPEYEFLLATIDHAKAWDSASPFAQPGRKIDLRTATMPF